MPSDFWLHYFKSKRIFHAFLVIFCVQITGTKATDANQKQTRQVIITIVTIAGIIFFGSIILLFCYVRIFKKRLCCLAWPNKNVKPNVRPEMLQTVSTSSRSTLVTREEDERSQRGQISQVNVSSNPKSGLNTHTRRDSFRLDSSTGLEELPSYNSVLVKNLTRTK